MLGQMDTHAFDKFKINKLYNLRCYKERRIYASSGRYCAYISVSQSYDL
jgi:hypothetical protein